MKTRLATIIDDYLLNLLFLFAMVYFDGAGVILICRNANKESGPAFTLFPPLQAKSRFEGKIAKIAYLQLLIKRERVCA